MIMDRKRLLALLLVLVMLVSVFPLSAFADDGEPEDVYVQTEEPAGELGDEYALTEEETGEPGDEYVPAEEDLDEPEDEYVLVEEETEEPLLTSIVCYGVDLSVTVYDANQEEILPMGENYYLTPGSYYYSAEAEGYESQTMQPFVIPEDAAGDQLLVITMTPIDPDTEEPQDQQDTAEPQNQEEEADDEEDLSEQVGGGIFSAHYSGYQVFSVYRSPAYPTGSQDSPNPFTVMDLAAPEFGMDADYYYLAPLGLASRVGVVVSGGWNTGAEDLDPYAVSVHAVTDGSDTEVARGVIGALSSEGFLFDGGGQSAWFSNSKGYNYSSTAVTYTPVAGGRLVCDVSLLTGCAAQSMLKPAADVSEHTHEWSVEAEGAAAVYSCVADGCPLENSKFTMSLSIPVSVASGTGVKATVLRASGDAEWPTELEQDVIYYVGRGDTEYNRSTIAPTADGTYTAEVSVGYRYLPVKLTADFAIGVVEEVPAEEEAAAEEGATPEEEEEAPKPFSQTQSVNGVVVTVNAEAGIFPADAVLSVTSVAIDEAMEFAASVQRGQALMKVASSAVEVNIVDKDGNALQTADGSPVSVALSLAEPAGNGMVAAFYRIMRDWEGYIYADPQPVNTDGGSITGTDLDGGLVYVVEVQKRDMPAKDFENYTGSLHVMASAPEGAFPRGTEMLVTPVYDQVVLQTIGDEVGADASQVTAVDITFYCNSEPVEPAC